MPETTVKPAAPVRKKRFGDRKEGRKLRSLDPIVALFPYICPNATSNVNLIKDSFDVGPVDRYIREKNAEGLKGFSMLHVMVAAYARTLAARPALNRFVSNRKIYARYNLDVCMTIKKELTLNAEETVIKIRPDLACTADDVYRLFNTEITKFRESSDENPFDSVTKVLNHIPGFVLRFIMRMLRFMDRHDLMPRSLIQASPFHASMYITSMGSLGIPSIFHHLYEFGNCPIFISYGAKRRVYEAQKDGTVAKKVYIDYNVTTDDRICDGHYYASALKLFKTLIKNPRLLDRPPETIVENVE